MATKRKKPVIRKAKKVGLYEKTRFATLSISLKKEHAAAQAKSEAAKLLIDVNDEIRHWKNQLEQQEKEFIGAYDKYPVFLNEVYEKKSHMDLVQRRIDWLEDFKRNNF